MKKIEKNYIYKLNIGTWQYVKQMLTSMKWKPTVAQ